MQSLTAKEVKRAADFFVNEIKRFARERSLRLMEVCGTHTVAIFKAGIRQLLPEEVELVSGPGCPVCVTPNAYLDTAIAYSRQSDVIIATFGDMLRVPGTKTTLLEARAQGGDIRIVYSPLDSLEIARANPAKKVIFLAVGFETTAPTAAATILTARQQNLPNFFVLSAHKLVPPALKALLTTPHVKVDGFLLPGHVSAIIGTEPYKFLGTEYGVPSVVAGFEPLDILRSVYLLVKQLSEGRAELENQYSRIVLPDGNGAARQVLDEVYQPCDAVWRGLGRIAESGLELKHNYQSFDALANLPVDAGISQDPLGCRCGEVLSGIVKPTECPLFGKACSPEHPIGACMVSVEGSCAAWYKYGAGRWQI